jgi:hypothetical protein
MGTFAIWLEEKLAMRQITKSLLSNLGYEPSALDTDDIIMRTRKLSDIERAISSLPINDQEKEKVLNFARTHRQEGLKSLLAQIDPDSLEKQDVDTSSPAVLPPSQQPMPKPVNQWQTLQKQQQQMQQPY